MGYNFYSTFQYITGLIAYGVLGIEIGGIKSNRAEWAKIPEFRF